jgi:GT2 family glycosyltransferase
VLDMSKYVSLKSLDDERLHNIFLDKNSGGAGGFYEGLKYVHERIKDYDWVLFLDDDAYAKKGVIDRFINKQHKSDISAYISAVYYPTGEICDMNVPGYHPFKDSKQIKNTIIKGAEAFHIHRDYYKKDGLKEVDFASFVGLFFRKEVVDSIGYPDKEWFIYGDDLDYTFLMTKNGFSICFDPSLIFIHDCETVQNGKKIYNPMWKAYFTYRNGLIIYRKLSGNLFPLVVVFKSMQWFLNFRFYKEKIKYIKLTFIAIFDGIKQDRSKKIDDIYF